ncbi:hypothetical protein HDU87_007318 [Geranomyces variabilis]|uniref:Uncharacterized protein n=1 Tax=Geranomyces variabilis TaxID=109894 RepID=A0AAD5TGH3_9FUNG|nr:hypothetical protein HDU87_007318 [Geranomyces variabilis]
MTKAARHKHETPTIRSAPLQHPSAVPSVHPNPSVGAPSRKTSLTSGCLRQSVPEALRELIEARQFAENEEVDDYDIYLASIFQQDPEAIREFRYHWFVKLAAELLYETKKTAASAQGGDSKEEPNGEQHGFNALQPGEDKLVSIALPNGHAPSKRLRLLQEYIKDNSSVLREGKRWTGERSFVKEITTYRAAQRGDLTRVIGVQPDITERTVVPLGFFDNHAQYDRYLDLLRPGQKEAEYYREELERLGKNVWL